MIRGQQSRCARAPEESEAYKIALYNSFTPINGSQYKLAPFNPPPEQGLHQRRPGQGQVLHQGRQGQHLPPPPPFEQRQGQGKSTGQGQGH